MAPEPPPRDAILVLGARVWPGGAPSPTLRRRLLHGVALHRRGQAPRLLLTGGIGPHPPSEASVMRRLALEEGVDDDAILLDEDSTSTLASAIRCAAILRERDLGPVWIVTDRYHLPRSLYLLRRLGVDALGSAPDHRPAGRARIGWWKQVLREVAAFPWSAIRVARVVRRGIPGGA